MRNKTFACSLPTGSLLGGLLEPGSLVVQCLSGSQGSGGNTCGIGFVVRSPRVPVQCQASSCTFITGQSNLTCANTTCSCPGDATCGNSSEWRRLLAMVLLDDWCLSHLHLLP
jgi:hypothetical protein